MNRTLNVSTPLGAEVLRFDGLQGRESLSQLFDFQLTMKSDLVELTSDPVSSVARVATYNREKRSIPKNR